MNPIETKKIAANRSRNGLSNSRTRTAVSPLSGVPLRLVASDSEVGRACWLALANVAFRWSSSSTFFK